jgi:hypothetical protein
VEAMVVLVAAVIVSSTVRLVKWYSMYIISFRNMSLKKEQNSLDFLKCQDLTAEVCGVSTSRVSRICREANILTDHGSAGPYHLERASAFQRE